MNNVYAIIAAGGTGTRMGSGIPKQYIKVSNKEIIKWTVEVFLRCESLFRKTGSRIQRNCFTVTVIYASLQAEKTETKRSAKVSAILTAIIIQMTGR